MPKYYIKYYAAKHVGIRDRADLKGKTDLHTFSDLTVVASSRIKGGTDAFLIVS